MKPRKRLRSLKRFVRLLTLERVLVCEITRVPDHGSAGYGGRRLVHVYGARQVNMVWEPRLHVTGQPGGFAESANRGI